MDAAAMAAQAFITNRQKKQEEEASAAKLVPYLQGLDNKSQTTILSKLAQENPNLFNLVTAQLKPAPEDPLDVAKRTGTLNAIGYNEDMKPFQNNVPGPVPAGWQPLPSDPAAAALQQSQRNTFLFGHEFGAASPIVAQTDRAQLTPADQPKSLRVATGLQPKADVIATQEGANARNAATVAATMRGQDVRATIAANRPGKTAAAKDESQAEMQSLIKQNIANNKQIEKNNVKYADPLLLPEQKKALQDQNRQLIAHNQQVVARYKELQGGKGTAAPKAYTPEQEAKIKEYMDLSKKSREEVIAAMLAEKEL